MTIREAVDIIGSRLPIGLVTDQDSVGLIVGDYDNECSRVSVAYELDSEVVDEAVANGVDLLVTYHSPLFHPAKTFTTSASNQNPIFEAANSGLGVFAVHTALDIVHSGLNFDLGTRLGLETLHILAPLKNTLFKLVAFVPQAHVEEVGSAMGRAGAGVIGNYSECSFRADGIGTFLPSEDASPYLGQPGRLEKVEESRIEVLVEKHLLHKVLDAMFASHPYEQVAYDIYPLQNTSDNFGFGAVGNLPNPISAAELIDRVKALLDLKFVKVSHLPDTKIMKVALCAGAGMSFYGEAVKAGADVFITGDIRHHDYRQARANRTVLVDATHNGTEKFAATLMHELFAEILKDKCDVLLSKQRIETAYVI